MLYVCRLFKDDFDCIAISNSGDYKTSIDNGKICGYDILFSYSYDNADGLINNLLNLMHDNGHGIVSGTPVLAGGVSTQFPIEFKDKIVKFLSSADPLKYTGVKRQYTTKYLNSDKSKWVITKTGKLKVTHNANKEYTDELSFLRDRNIYLEAENKSLKQQIQDNNNLIATLLADK